jgi:hypothetical protein
MEQDLAMMRWVDAYPWIKPMCLGVTAEGHPRHPLYVPSSARLVPYEGRWFVASGHKATGAGEPYRVAISGQRGSRGASSARIQARSRRAQSDPSRASSLSTQRPISSARTGKNSLTSTAR